MGKINKFWGKKKSTTPSATEQVRSEEDIKKDYTMLCSQAGEIQYKIEEFQTVLRDLNRRLNSLNREYSTALDSKAKEETSNAISETKKD